MPSLIWTDVEVSPFDASRAAYDGDMRIEHDVARHLTPAESALLASMDEPDAHTCAVPGCEQPVGYVLHEDDDNPARSGLAWHWTTLVLVPGNDVRAVCEECSPTYLYGAD